MLSLPKITARLVEVVPEVPIDIRRTIIMDLSVCIAAAMVLYMALYSLLPLSKHQLATVQKKVSQNYLNEVKHLTFIQSESGHGEESACRPRSIIHQNSINCQGIFQNPKCILNVRAKYASTYFRH
jgi:hypothetical protein